jgi:hypothetical protein
VKGKALVLKARALEQRHGRRVPVAPKAPPPSNVPAPASAPTAASAPAPAPAPPEAPGGKNPAPTEPAKKKWWKLF